MKNLIPHLIHNKYQEGVYEGDFNAITLFIDISGFTPMTEKLMHYGKEGAEVLSAILDNVFKPVIDAIYNRGGFVSGFAGDACTVIFIDIDNPISALFSAVAINKLFKKQGLQKTRFGDFDLSVKLGLSFGKVHWGIVGSKRHKTYFFRDEAIDGCAYAEHQCDKMDIVLDKKLVDLLDIKDIDIEKLDDTYFKLLSIKKQEKKIETVSISEIEKEIAGKFLPKSVLNYKYKGEFRDVVSVFISFVEPDSFEKLNKFISNILNKVKKFGGYFNSLDFGDKGSNMLIIFGAPISYEDSIKRSINFIQWLKDKFKDKIRVGITFGTVYAGLVGSEKRCAYTCLGDVINLSARFMMKANWGSVWISEEIMQKIETEYETKDLETKEFKGKAEPIQVFSLLEPKKKIESLFFEGETVGRQAEFEKFKEYCKPILNKTGKRFGGVVYIYGEAGIGKSRLLYDIAEELKSYVKTFILQTDGILKKGLNPFTYFFNNYFEQYEIAIEKRKAKFDGA